MGGFSPPGFDKSLGLSGLRNFMADIKISLRNTIGQSKKWRRIRSQDNFYLAYSRILVGFRCCYTLDLSIGFVNTLFHC